MKRSLALLAVLGVLAGPGHLAAQNIPVGFGGQLSSAVQMSFVVPLQVDLTGRTERLGSFALRMSWNPAVLRVDGGSDGTFGSVRVNEDSLPLGVARFAGVNAAGAGGLVTLANIRMTPLTKDTTTLVLAVSELYAAGTFADLLPSAVASNGAFCPARGLWGDIDGDGNANSRDALIALSNAVGLDVSAFDITLGDADGNGATNARDALIILSNAVGVDVSAFRVLRLAPGACSAGGTVTLAIAPAGVELLGGQSVRFEARASDSTGALQTIPDATWRSSDARVLSMLADGQAQARDTGTAVVTAYRGTRDSARTTVRVVARRSTHWVDAAAEVATNRLGTSDLPFARIEDALSVAQGGDTVRIRVGRYTPGVGSSGFSVTRPVVLLGDTAADGSRPVLAGGGWSSGATGLFLMDSGAVEVQNLDIRDFATAVWVGGPARVLVRGLRASGVLNGLYIGGAAQNVRVEASQLLGLGQPGMPGSPAFRSPTGLDSLPYPSGPADAGIETQGAVDTLTIREAEVGGFATGILLAVPPDSTAIQRSVIHDNSAYGVTDWYYGGGMSAPTGARGAAAPRPRLGGITSPTDPALVIDSSLLARSASWLVSLSSFRSVRSAHNAYTSPGSNVLEVIGGGGGTVTLVGDSIAAPSTAQHWYWLQVERVDTLVVDSVVAIGAQYGHTYLVDFVRVANTTLRDMRSAALSVNSDSYVGAPGGVLQIDNVAAYGDPRDDAAAYAVEYSGTRVDADRLTVENFYAGVDGGYGDSSVTVTNSLFRHVRYPVYWGLYNLPGPSTSTLTVKRSTFDGFQWGVEAYDGRVVVDTNTFANGWYPIAISGYRQVAVRGNQMTGTQQGIEVSFYDSSTTALIADNVMTGIVQRGIYASGSTYPDSLRYGFSVGGNSVTCAPEAAGNAPGIVLEDADLLVTGNTVQGCYEGIRTALYTAAPRLDSIVGNTVTAPAGALAGIGVSGLALARVARNTVVGAATGAQQAGLIDVAACPPSACPDLNVPEAVIDSNLVQGGTVWGIHVSGADSLVVEGNTVLDLNAPTGSSPVYPEDFGAIALLGSLTRSARLAGNVVKRVVGNGIVVNTADTTTVAVDLNVVANADSSGIYFDGGFSNAGVAITRNLVTASRRDGVRINGYGPVTLTDNNIFGNAPYGAAVYADRSPVAAPANWWGDAKGPRNADTSSTGDATFAIDWTFFRTAPNDSAPTAVPAGAPQYIAVARPPASLAAAAAAAAGPRYAPFTEGDRLPAPRPVRSGGRVAAGGAAEAGRAAGARAEEARAAGIAEQQRRIREHLAAQERERQERETRRPASAPPARSGQGVRP